MKFGTGPAKALDKYAFARAAKALKCHPADLEAIAQVESGGYGWFDDGRIKLLFEKHVFYRRLPATVRARAVAKKLARRKWISPKRGGYRDQKGASSRYKLFEKAIEFHDRAAYESASYGSYQIMGFNYKPCGYSSAKDMFEAFLTGEQAQLDAFIKFLKSRRLVVAMRKRDFALIEKRYNGGGLGGAYARRMKRASDKLRKGKWRGWNPDSIPKVEFKPAPAPKPTERPKADYEPVAPEPQPKATSKAAPAVGVGIAALATAVYAGWDWITSFFGG